MCDTLKEDYQKRLKSVIAQIEQMPPSLRALDPTLAAGLEAEAKRILEESEAEQ